MGTSVWINDMVLDFKQAEEKIRGLYPSGNPGDGGHFFESDWLSATNCSFLQKFSQNLLGELRYQTCEIFIAKPFYDLNENPEMQLVAAAYRKTDSYGVRHEGKPKSVYNLSENKLSKLKSIMLYGENYCEIEKRINLFLNNDNDNDILQYINYSIITTVIVSLSSIGNCNKAGEYFWYVIKNYNFNWFEKEFKKYKGYPTNNVRLFLKQIIIDYGNTIIEKEDESDFIKQIEMAKDGDYKLAILLFFNISHYSEDIVSAIRNNLSDMPSSIVKFLFEAKLKSYPYWLKSATLDAEVEKKSIIHGNLRNLINNSKKNKQINTLSLHSYEENASWVLLNENNKTCLKSMVLIPIEIDTNGKHISCLVRFMNRYKVVDNKQTFFTYHDENIIDNEDELVAYGVYNALAYNLRNLIKKESVEHEKIATIRSHNSSIDEIYIHGDNILDSIIIGDSKKIRDIK